MRRSTLKRKSRLSKKGKSASSKAKDRIQDLLRAHVIKRDGGCVLRHYDEAGECGGYRNDGELILQAEHLNGRASSVSYAELENIVCLCKYHHIFFKKYNTALYWVLIRRHLGEKRWKKVERWILDKTPYHMVASDWEKIANELEKSL